MGLLLLVAGPAAAAELNFDALGAEATQMLRRYIRVDTSNPPGNEIAAARYLAGVFGAEGIEHRVLESEPGRGTVIAWLPGRGNGRPVVLLNHLDTVSADASAWRFPPFEGVVDDGFLYGRGAIDCKGMAVVEAMAMIAIKRSGETLDRDLIFLGTADEEVGGALGAGWFVENHLDLLGNAEYVLNEGGHGRVLADGTVVYEVGAVEKTPYWLRLTATGEPGHGSTPRGLSSVARLVRALERVRTMPRPIRVTPEVALYYQALAARQPEPLQAKYRNLADALEQDEEFRRQFLSRPEDAALVQSTISITVLEGSDKTNVVPGVASADLDCRLLPGEEPADFRARLEQAIGDDGIEIEVLLNFPPSSSTIDSDLYASIVRMAESEGASVVPNVLRGFTDSHFFRTRGMTVYGFVPIVLTDEDTKRMHGIDERVPVAEIGAGVERLVSILRGIAAK